MGTLKLAANYIEATTAVFQRYGHLQIVYEGSGSSQEIEVQAPYSADYFFDEGIHFAYPPVRAHLDPGNTTGTDNPPFTYEIVTLDTGDRNPDKVWELLEIIHEQFVTESPNYLYTLNQNSNSYAATLLWMVGIDIFAYLDQVTPVFVLDGFPGSDRNILTDSSLSFDLVLTATDANDILNTGAGADILHGADGDDTISSGSGNDELFGDVGSDYLYGGQGDDKLYGGTGDDELYGEDNKDTLVGGAGDDLLDGGNGIDTADYSAAANVGAPARTAGIKLVSSDTSVTVDDGLGGVDTLIGIEVLKGTLFDDIFAFEGN